MVGTVTDSLHTMHSEIEEYEKIELESSLEEYKRLLTEAKQAILSRSIVSNCWVSHAMLLATTNSWLISFSNSLIT